MVVYELLHTGQNLVTDGVKIDLCLDKEGGHLVILPRQKLKLPICILRQFGRLKFLPIGQTVQSDLHTLKKEALYHHLYETPQELEEVLEEYIEFYNGYRPHRKLNMKTPIQYEAEFFSATEDK